MTDWSELKVIDLKEELRSRGIPLTGLKLKQQFVDKLNELDAEVKNGIENSDLDAVAPLEPNEENGTNQEITASQPHQDTLNESINNDATERVAKLPEDLPIELKQEESQATDQPTPPPAEAVNTRAEEVIREEDPFVVQEQPDETFDDKMVTDDLELRRSRETEDEVAGGQKELSSDLIDSKESTGSLTEKGHSPRAGSEMQELEGHKRKRRSTTPVPDTQEFALKKAKMNDGTALAVQTESDALLKIQNATDASQKIRSADGLGHDNEIRPKEDSVRAQSPKEPPPEYETRSSVPRMVPRSRSRSRSETRSERSVSPALHPATCSLYIRNFKRPLHLPSLRSYILSLAKPSAEDPIKLFYLDTIRTHAFVSFVSVSAASRVRNSMHGSPFPDEPMRDPLWIDFIPDDKVEEWIEIESGSGGGDLGGGRMAAKRYEVVYVDGQDKKIQARLQEVPGSSTVQSQRLGFQQSRSSRPSVPHDSTASGAATSSVHPSRATLVPRSPEVTASRSVQRPHHPQSENSNRGTGFRALDELFGSTVTKPKLYYKLVSQSVIDARLDTIRDLRVGHNQMGRTGDEGMKRYSFEANSPNSWEEWVDKGPEFGFGRRGQERLSGFGNSHSGGRGRGGIRGSRRGGDSWRGR